MHGHTYIYIYIYNLCKREFVRRTCERWASPLYAIFIVHITPKKKKKVEPKKEKFKNPLFEKIIYIYITIDIAERTMRKSNITPRKEKEKEKRKNKWLS